VEWLLELWCEGRNSLYRRRPPETLPDERRPIDQRCHGPSDVWALVPASARGGSPSEVAERTSENQSGAIVPKSVRVGPAKLGSWISMLVSTRPPQHSHVKNKYNSLQASRIALCLRIIGLEDEVRRIHYGNSNRKQTMTVDQYSPSQYHFPANQNPETAAQLPAPIRKHFPRTGYNSRRERNLNPRKHIKTRPCVLETISTCEWRHRRITAERSKLGALHHRTLRPRSTTGGTAIMRRYYSGASTCAEMECFCGRRCLQRWLIDIENGNRIAPEIRSTTNAWAAIQVNRAWIVSLSDVGLRNIPPRAGTRV
jgi:hypothetical protein